MPAGYQRSYQQSRTDVDVNFNFKCDIIYKFESHQNVVSYQKVLVLLHEGIQLLGLTLDITFSLKILYFNDTWLEVYASNCVLFKIRRIQLYTFWLTKNMFIFFA